MHVEKKSADKSLAGTRQSMYAECNIEERWRNHCCRGRAISITYSECVCSLKLLRIKSSRAVFYCHLCPPLPPQHFSTADKLHDWRRKIIRHKMFWFFLQLLPETFLTLRRNKQDISLFHRAFFNSIMVCCDPCGAMRWTVDSPTHGTTRVTTHTCYSIAATTPELTIEILKSVF